MPMSDPNFPPRLDIKPLGVDGWEGGIETQREAVVSYGIAGRVW